MTLLNLGYEKCPKEPFTDCIVFHKKWANWCVKRDGANLALLEVTADYFDNTLDSKSRNMVRKATKYFYYSPFEYNYKLSEIHRINTSTPHRQGQPMTPAYTVYPSPIGHRDVLCLRQHRYMWIGGSTEDGQLQAYAAVAVLGDLAIINTILGHADQLTYGVMNGLIAYLNAYLLRNTGVVYLNYLDLRSCTKSMRKFKESVGFVEKEVSFVY